MKQIHKQTSKHPHTTHNTFDIWTILEWMRKTWFCYAIFDKSFIWWSAQALDKCDVSLSASSSCVNMIFLQNSSQIKRFRFSINSIKQTHLHESVYSHCQNPIDLNEIFGRSNNCFSMEQWKLSVSKSLEWIESNVVTRPSFVNTLNVYGNVWK